MKSGKVENDFLPNRGYLVSQYVTLDINSFLSSYQARRFFVIGILFLPYRCWTKPYISRHTARMNLLSRHWCHELNAKIRATLSNRPVSTRSRFGINSFCRRSLISRGSFRSAPNSNTDRVIVIALDQGGGEKKKKEKGRRCSGKWGIKGGQDMTREGFLAFGSGMAGLSDN